MGKEVCSEEIQEMTQGVCLVGERLTISGKEYSVCCENEQKSDDQFWYRSCN